MKLSVVIPVYRVEDTLNRCVESVLRQAVDDMEVILVDDGSPDRCPQMCDEWAAKEQRIKVIHQANSGLSEARNAGIAMATGDYLTFVDSDDWLADDTYPPIMRALADNDIVEYSVAGRLLLSDTTYTDIRRYWSETRAYTHTYAWNKIYKRCLFDEVRFPKGRIFEDVYTFPLLLQQVRRIATTSHGSYHYELNPHGITATADGQGLSMLLDAHLTCPMPVDEQYYMYLVNIQMDVWERTAAPPLLPARKIRIREVQGRKSKLKALAINILGINRLCRINKFLHRFKRPSRW